MTEIPKHKSGMLARALASGKPAAEAAASLELTLDDVATLMQDPIYLDLIDGWRRYLAAGSEAEQIEQLTLISWIVLRGEAARGNPEVIAFLESQDLEAECGPSLH